MSEYDPYDYGPVRGCDVCGKNKPTESVDTVRDEAGEIHSICRDCQTESAA